MRKWFVALAAALAVLIGVTPAQARTPSLFFFDPPVQVMSQNLYIGADLAKLLDGTGSPATVLQTVLETDYPGRAAKIAQAIDDFNPDLIGLQEVSWITVSDSTGKIQFELNYLDILLGALNARGEHYAVASTANESDVKLPIDASTFGRVRDRDVVLYRTTTTSVSRPSSAHFTTNFTTAIQGQEIVFTRGYTGVNANVRGRTYRFVNTHLEVEDVPCDKLGQVICQNVQSAELQKALSSVTLPTILVGDFNAVPGSTAYKTIDNGGYLDTWTIRVPYNNEPGFTCCQSEKLNNVQSQLNQRIDHIWLSDGDFGRPRAVTTVVGDWEARKTPGGLWYSDHGGPFAEITRR